MVDVDLDMTAGEPYAREFLLLGGGTAWPDGQARELRAHVRDKPLPGGTLRYDLSPYLTAQVAPESARPADTAARWAEVFPDRPVPLGPDLSVRLSLTGQQTRALSSLAGGRALVGVYDAFVSEPDQVDARSTRVGRGRVVVDPAVTGP